MKYFKLPDLGEGLTEAEIVQWHITLGDTVKTDQIIVSVETAKAIVDVPSPKDGIIIKLFGQAGDIINTGAPLVEYEEGKDTGTVVGEIKTATTNIESEDDFIIGFVESDQTQINVQATPAARILAEQLNIDLSQITSTEKNGLITPNDVEHYFQEKNNNEEPKSLRGIRRSMAKTMALSHANVVPVTLVEDADIHAWPEKTDTTIRIIQAIAAACQTEPVINSWFEGDKLTIQTIKKIDLGIAMDTEDGLFVPVLRDIANRHADNLRSNLDQLHQSIKDRSIAPEKLTGATVILSNYGTMCGRYANTIIVPPMVAIIGTGSIRKEPVAYKDTINIHPILPLSLTIDHRAVTGGEAARFLQALIDNLQLK